MARFARSVAALKNFRPPSRRGCFGLRVAGGFRARGSVSSFGGLRPPVPPVPLPRHIPLSFFFGLPRTSGRKEIEKEMARPFYMGALPPYPRRIAPHTASVARGSMSLSRRKKKPPCELLPGSRGAIT